MEAMTMDGYTCDKCPWHYVWTMGGRVRAVKRHQLAHLLDQPAGPEGRERRKMEVPANELMEYLHERLRNVEFL
jgi:hypothetical protein